MNFMKTLFLAGGACALTAAIVMVAPANSQSPATQQASLAGKPDTLSKKDGAKAPEKEKATRQDTAKAKPAKASLGNQDEDEQWDVMNPPGAQRDIDIKVSKGTWMSLDVSADGQTIAFDLLGDIYTMRASGGVARNIASGMAWEIQPRFSPDGKKIAFTSDRAGGDNIWIMDVDGGNKTQVTKESFRLLNNPTWSPDGQYLAARKHFTTSRSLGTGEIWMYHIKGGSGVKLVKRPSETHQKELGEPMFSPDGRFIYYSQNTTPGATFEYAQDSNTQLFQIKRYDMQSGDIDSVVGGAGGAVRPTPSPNGKSIAYVKRVRAQSKLFLKDLASGEERMIFDNLDQDMQETWAVQGVYPNMDWSPDGQYLYFWADGGIHRYNARTEDITHIPFIVSDTRTVMDAPRPSVKVAPDTFKTHMPRFVSIAPDGKTMVLESLGKLYLRNQKTGKMSRLTKLKGETRELYPSWSRDSQKIVFTTWNDDFLGSIHTIDVRTRTVSTVSKTPGHYKRPRFSPKGGYITYEKGSGGYLTSPNWSNDTGVYIQDTDGGKPIQISKSGNDPQFDGDELRVFFTKREEGKSLLVSTNLLGDALRKHANSGMAQSYTVSLDGRYAAFRENYNLYVTPLLNGPQNVATGMKADALPITKVSHGGATYPSWNANGDLYWTLGPTLYSKSIDEIMDDGYEPPTSGTDISTKVTASKPKGRIALTGARIVTMAAPNGGVIENGTIVIDSDRIVAVGDDVSLRAAVTIDMRGKTIIPGLIDAHAHGPQGTDGLIPQQNWSAIAHLALGVTTIFDPSSRASEIFVASEMQRAGKLLAPRIYSTGEVIYGAKAPGFFANIQSESDADEHVARLKNQGAHGVKNYNQPRRDQRQQVVKAARDHDLIVVAEGGSLFHMDMSLVQDGNTSLEHNLPQARLYDDVIQMYSQTNVAYTPTLVVTYGGVRGEDYYYQDSDVWKHELLSKHVPPTVLQARAVRRQMAPMEDYADDKSAATAKQLADAGVLVNIGAHGQREGLASHWELWSFVRGGMSPLEALFRATMNPAKHLGFSDDIGSLEVGKLADLVVLNANPLDDIRNSDDIDSVMIGGRLYDAQTMDEVYTGDSKRLPYWWEAKDE